MFCIYCGKPVNDEGNFCPYCGREIKQKLEQRIATPENTVADTLPAQITTEIQKLINVLTQIKEIKNGRLTSKKVFAVNYLGQTIVYPKEYCYVLNLEVRYREKAKRAEQRYKNYYESYGDFENFYNSGLKQGITIVKEYIDDAVHDFNNRGIHDIDSAGIISLYGPLIFSKWAEIMQDFDDLLDHINAQIEGKQEMRNLRKASRRRLIGGGFGVKGAIKGIALAGSYNTLSGLVHSGVNAIGNSMTRGNYRRKLNDLYKDPNIKELLCNTIYNSILSLGEIVKAHQGISFVIITEDAVKQSRSLRTSLSSLSSEKQPQKVAELLKTSAWDLDNYRLLLDEFGDQDGALYKIAQMAGLLSEFKEVRKEVYEEELSIQWDKIKKDMMQFDVVDLYSPQFPEFVNQARDVWSKAGTHLGYSQDCAEIRSEIDKLMEKIRGYKNELKIADEQARTFNGIVFPTVESASLAKNVWTQALEIEQNFEGQPSSNQKNLLLKIEHLDSVSPALLKESIKLLYEKLNDIYKKTELQERTFLNTVFPTQEARNAAKAQYDSALAKWLPAGSTLSFSDLQAAKQAIESQNDLVEPVRKAVLKKIALKEDELNQEIHQQQVKKVRHGIESKLIVWNLLYGVVVIWGLLFWDVFIIDGFNVGGIDLFRLFYYSTDYITAGRGFLAVGVIVIVITTLSNMRKTLDRDLNEALSYPGAILFLGLLAWGFTAIFHLSYGVTVFYFAFLIISLAFQIINSAGRKKIDLL